MSGHIFGVAQIKSNDAGGDYKITALYWNAAGSAYVEMVSPSGLVNAVARDYQDRAVGVEGQTVRYWTQEVKGGGYEVLISVSDTVLWGKMTGNWPQGADHNATEVNPCLSDGSNTDATTAVTVWLYTPITHDGPASCSLVTGDVIAYLPYDATSGIIINGDMDALIPSGTGRYKVLQLDINDDPTWDWVRAH